MWARHSTVWGATVLWTCPVSGIYTEQMDAAVLGPPGEKRHININFLLWLTSRWPWDKRLVVPGLTGPKVYVFASKHRKYKLFPPVNRRVVPGLSPTFKKYMCSKFMCLFLVSIFLGMPRFVPICSNLLRFLPICADLFSEQIRTHQNKALQSETGSANRGTAIVPLSTIGT